MRVNAMEIGMNVAAFKIYFLKSFEYIDINFEKLYKIRTLLTCLKIQEYVTLPEKLKFTNSCGLSALMFENLRLR